MRYRVKTGTLRINGEKYVPGDSFEADNVPEAFLTTLEVLGEKTEPEKKIARRKPPTLKLVHKGSGRYEVVNTVSGKKLTDKLVSKKEALAIIGKEKEGDVI
jgi:hypothetical protein